jgi:hypothetical protein
VAEAGITGRRIGYARRGVRGGLRHRDGEPELAISAFYGPIQRITGRYSA